MIRKIVFLIVILTLSQLISLSYADDLKPISGFKVQQFMGTWYELARLPISFENKCSPPITISYAMDSKKKNQLNVVNKCSDGDGDEDIANGVADFVDSTDVGKLKITFWPKYLRWMLLSHVNYWVLSVDYNKLAVIGSKNRKYLWILAREKNINKDTLKQGIDIAHNFGFDTTMLIYNYPDMEPK